MSHLKAAAPECVWVVQVGAVLALFGNSYVLYTYMFQLNRAQRKEATTSLLAWAALAELVFCICLVAQEASFRIPNDPCAPDAILHPDKVLDAKDCGPAPLYGASALHGWPLWLPVQSAVEAENRFKTGSVDMHEAGQRGGKINHCKTMSFMFQLMWSASDSFYFMISVDLFLNLVTSPFGSQKRRWFIYHGWTWTLAVTMAVLLMFSGDWGASENSILEDFCWNVNFGAPHTDYKNSNWPLLQLATYGISVVYVIFSVVVMVLALFKVRRGKLTEGQRRARGAKILEGLKLVLACTVWWVSIFLFYKFVVLPAQENIIHPAGRKSYDELDMQYRKKQKHGLTSHEACESGGHDPNNNTCYSNQNGSIGIRFFNP